LAANGIDSPPPRVTIGALFKRRGFWLNFGVTLLATCWVPLLTIQPRFETFAPVVTQDASNTGALSPTPAPLVQEPQPRQVIEGEARRVPLYECYAGLFRAVTQGNFASRAFRIYGGAVAAHILLCFVISLWVWLIVLRSGAK
jgi:hypothetical protein